MINIKIKVKETTKKGIKSIDKGLVMTDKLKNTMVEAKDITNNIVESQDNNINEYTINNITNTIKHISKDSIHIYNKLGKKSFINAKNKIKDIKQKNKTIKNTNKAIKTSNKVLVKGNKTTIKNSKRLVEYSKTIVKKTYQLAKVTIKITISSIKAIVAGSKALISLILAGGWISVIIIIIMSIVGLLCSSFYGVFFTNENDNSNITINNVIENINQDLDNKINQLKKENTYDEVIINTNLPEWKNILSIYSVITSSNNQEVVTLNETKINNIKDIFWNATNIKTSIKKEDNKQILYIDITSISLEELINKYNLNNTQKQEVLELLNNEYNDLWASIIHNINNKGFIFPVKDIYTLTTYYSNEHKAIDIASSYGTNIYAISSGTVIVAKDGCIVGDLTCNGKAGNYITIKHDNYYSSYMHLKSLNVKVGDYIDIGTIIGTMGNTGNVIPIPEDINSTNGTHLHLTTYKINTEGIVEYIDPLSIISE